MILLVPHLLTFLLFFVIFILWFIVRVLFWKRCFVYWTSFLEDFHAVLLAICKIADTILAAVSIDIFQI